jgi:hypothetical protein
MAVVVGGKYNGGTKTYYRIDFATGPHNNRQLVNVLRNHLYRISIADVTGPGEATPEEAYNATSVNMNVDVIEWNEVDMSEIFVDGVRWIRLRNSFNENLSRRAVLYRPAGSVDRIYFETNIPISEWDESLSHYGEIQTEDILNEDGEKIGERTFFGNRRFEVEINHDDTSTTVEKGQNITIYHGHFRFVARVAAEYDTGVADMPSTLTIKSRRIRFPIIIEQRGDAPDDWQDGGNQDVEVGRPRP